MLERGRLVEVHPLDLVLFTLDAQFAHLPQIACA